MTDNCCAAAPGSFTLNAHASTECALAKRFRFFFFFFCAKECFWIAQTDAKAMPTTWLALALVGERCIKIF